MNECVLHISSEKGWRGGEQQIAYLIEEQVKRGLQVVVALRKNSDFEKFCQKIGVTYVAVELKSSFNIKTALQIKRLAKQSGANVIHVHSAKSHSIAVLSAALGNKTPIILSRRVDFVPKNSFITRWKYNHDAIRKIVCVSDKIREIMQAYIRHPEKAITIHSGIDVDKFKQRPTTNILRSEFRVSPSDVVIGNTSALEDHKDYVTFINTIECLVKQQFPVKAFIVGKGSLETMLKDYIKTKGLQDIIIMTGFRDDIQNILPGLDVFLMTSKEEGLGTSVLDAFACEIPVVATKAGGIPEMVSHGLTGMLSDVGDAASLAQQVIVITRDRQFRDKIVSQATVRLGDFTKQKTAEKTIAVYRQILSRT